MGRGVGGCDAGLSASADAGTAACRLGRMLPGSPPVESAETDSPKSSRSRGSGSGELRGVVLDGVEAGVLQNELAPSQSLPPDSRSDFAGARTATGACRGSRPRLSQKAAIPVMFSNMLVWSASVVPPPLAWAAWPSPGDELF